MRLLSLSTLLCLSGAALRCCRRPGVGDSQLAFTLHTRCVREDIFACVRQSRRVERIQRAAAIVIHAGSVHPRRAMDSGSRLEQSFHGFPAPASRAARHR
jgi:hypothetical protein